MKTKFDGGLIPAPGCVGRLENQVPNDCLTVDQAPALATLIDRCVDGLVAALDPPPLDQTKCGAAKKKCVSKKVAGLLKCHRLAQTPGRPAEPNANGCIDKVKAKFDGGAAPTKGCFEKLENKVPNDCLTFDDTAAVEALADTCVTQAEGTLALTCEALVSGSIDTVGEVDSFAFLGTAGDQVDLTLVLTGGFAFGVVPQATVFTPRGIA